MRTVLIVSGNALPPKIVERVNPRLEERITDSLNLAQLHGERLKTARSERESLPLSFERKVILRRQGHAVVGSIMLQLINNAA